MAECSESTGKIGTPISLAKGIISAPATTKVSLLARAIGLPALIAFTVGNKPAYPTKAVKTMSTESNVTTSSSAFAPE